MIETKTTRLPPDPIEAAEAEGREEHRSAAEQVEHGARCCMVFAGQTDVSRRIQPTVAGRVPLSELTPEERLAADPTIGATISVAVSSVSFAGRRSARGVTTVLVAEEGRLNQRHPDGTTTVL